MIKGKGILEIKSHSDELLKEVERFMKNRSQFFINHAASKVEKELKDQVDFLRRVLNVAEKNS